MGIIEKRTISIGRTLDAVNTIRYESHVKSSVLLWSVFVHSKDADNHIAIAMVAIVIESKGSVHPPNNR
jgi:hypothetical protein